MSIKIIDNTDPEPPLPSKNEKIFTAVQAILPKGFKAEIDDFFGKGFLRILVKGSWFRSISRWIKGIPNSCFYPIYVEMEDDNKQRRIYVFGNDVVDVAKQIATIFHQFYPTLEIEIILEN